MNEVQITLGEVKRDLSKLVDRVARRRERVVLTFHGKPQAALISLEDYERLKQQTEGADRLARWQVWLAENDKLSADILQRRGGQPIDVDQLLQQDRADLEARLP